MQLAELGALLNRQVGFARESPGAFIVEPNRGVELCLLRSRLAKQASRSSSDESLRLRTASAASLKARSAGSLIEQFLYLV